MQSVMSKSDAITWVTGRLGKVCYEDGGASGTQCVELVSTYAGVLMNTDVKPSQCGNGNKCATNLPKNFPWAFKSITNLKDVQTGDILSWWSTSSIQQGVNLYGHTGVVRTVDGKGNYTTIEQSSGVKYIYTRTLPIIKAAKTSGAIIGIARPIYNAIYISNQEIQQRLNDLGYTPKLVVDGVIGPKSTAAIKWFQAAKKLSATGSLTDSLKQTIMSTASLDPAKDIWTFLKAKGLNSYAIAGLMGNLYAESALNPINLQNSYETKLGVTDLLYTYLVDSGKYTNFVKDSAGYGLAQWTYYTRKQALLDYAKSKKTSIGNLTTQLEFLWTELQSYSTVIKTLKTATSVRQASDVVLLQFERPADTSSSVQVRRAAYGQGYYEKYS